MHLDLDEPRLLTDMTFLGLNQLKIVARIFETDSSFSRMTTSNGKSKYLSDLQVSELSTARQLILLTDLLRIMQKHVTCNHLFIQA